MQEIYLQMQENELGVGGGNLIKVREFCFAEIVDTG